MKFVNMIFNFVRNQIDAMDYVNQNSDCITILTLHDLIRDGIITNSYLKDHILLGRVTKIEDLDNLT